MIFSQATYQHFFGLTDADDIAFAEEIGAALKQVDERLLPPTTPMPLLPLTTLLKELQQPQTFHQQQQLLESLAQHFIHHGATREAIDILNQQLQRTTDPLLIALLAKCLAISGDIGFAQTQIERLSDSDPLLVASAAKLLGYAGYQPAVPLLCTMLTPERFIESPHIIWALGEIGDERALPVLQHSLEAGFKTVECLQAIGKIGHLVSAPLVMTWTLQGNVEQRLAAYEAMATILDRNRQHSAALAVLREQFLPLLERALETNANTSPLMGIYMLLCYARLGGKMQPARLRQLLKAELSLHDAKGLERFLIQRRK